MSAIFVTNSSASFSIEQDRTDILVENIKTLIGMLDGREFDETKARAAFEAVYDKNCTGLISSKAVSLIPLDELMDPSTRVEVSFEEFYEKIFKLLWEKRVPVKLIDIQAKENEKIDFSFETANSGHPMTVKIHCQTRNGKVIRTERGEIDLLFVNNLKNYFEKFDGSEYDASIVPAFENLFDENSVSLTYNYGVTPMEELSDPTKRTEFHYKDIYKNICEPCAKNRDPVKLVNLTLLEGATARFTIKRKCQDKWLTLQYRVTTKPETGKIIRAELEKAVVENN